MDVNVSDIISYSASSFGFANNSNVLVIMVTPRLARPLQNPQPSLPTDTFVAPDDRAFYLLGQFQPEVQSATDNPQKRIAHAGAEGEYGHDLGGDY